MEKIDILRHNRGVAQSGRVLALGARCRMFESCRPDHCLIKRVPDGARFIKFGCDNPEFKQQFVELCSNMSLGRCTICVRPVGHS